VQVNESLENIYSTGCQNWILSPVCQKPPKTFHLSTQNHGSGLTHCSGSCARASPLHTIHLKLPQSFHHFIKQGLRSESQSITIEGICSLYNIHLHSSLTGHPKLRNQHVPRTQAFLLCSPFPRGRIVQSPHQDLALTSTSSIRVAMTDQAQARKLLSELSKREDLGNKVCADCNNPNPQWASLGYVILAEEITIASQSSSFAIFVCLQCAGTHRSFGVHIRPASPAP